MHEPKPECSEGQLKDRIKKRIYRYTNGKIKRISRHKNGKLHCRQVHYFLNGNRSCVATYENGNKVGLHIDFYPNGRIANICIMKKKFISYREDGSIKTLRMLRRLYSNYKRRWIYMQFNEDKKIEIYREYTIENGSENANVVQRHI